MEEEVDSFKLLKTGMMFWGNCISLSGRLVKGIQFEANGKFQTWVQSYIANATVMKTFTTR